MLSRVYILKGKENFDRVLKEGKMVQSASFGLAYKERGDDKDSLFGFVVSTKVSPHSVLRNRIKRAMSEAVRYERILLKGGFDVVFLAKQIAVKKSTDEIMREVKGALSQAKLYK